MYTDEIPSLDPTDVLPARRALTGDPVRDAAVWHRLPCGVRTPDDRPTGLWIGGDLHDDDEVAAAQLREWLELGVAHVVDCREERSDQDLVAELAPWVRYTHVGVDDHGGHQRDEWFDEGVDAALASLAEGRDVYVHCHMGINRGPSMAFAVLLALGWPVTDALDAIIAARPIVGVIYAADAVRWWGTRNGWTTRELDHGLGLVRGWHAAQDIDIETVIRVIWMAD